MKTTYDFANDLINYFNAKFIGSILFVEEGLLELKDVNDIDLLIDKKDLHNIYKYLIDNNFLINNNLKQIIYYEQFSKNIICTLSHKDLKIHLCVVDNLKNQSIFDIYTLISNKLKRGDEKDFKQIKKIIEILENDKK